jgi:methionyl-tRNA formyltransferase
MRLILEMDAGDILLQKSTAITPNETGPELEARLAKVGAALMLQGLEQLESGTAEFRPQNEDQVTFCNLIHKDDGRIRWAQPARVIHNQVRALVSWPTAHCLLGDQVCRIHRTEVVSSSSTASPGTIIATEKDRILIATGEGQIAILAIQLPGKRAMEVGDFLRGSRLKPDDCFKDIS